MWRTLAIGVVAVAVASVFATPSLPELRMTPDEIRASSFDGGLAGSSGLAEVRTKVLFGDPTKAGFYSILLFVPTHTTIQAHSHRDDRMATVVLGEWQFGYGNHFDPKSLKTLPAGSVYSEPGGVNHFARTDKDAAVLQISGSGPTDTRYVDAAQAPRRSEKD